MVRRGCLPLLAAVLTTACASADRPGPKTPRRVRTPAAPVTDRAAARSGHVGRRLGCRVERPGAASRWTPARESTRVGAGRAPTEPVVLSERRRGRALFGELLRDAAARARHFTLFFKFESEELTDESRRVVQQVLQEVKARQVPDVVAVGHTDTTGRARANVQLGLRRANGGSQPARQCRPEPVGRRGGLARRGRAARPDRRRRVRAAEPARRNHRSMTWTDRRLAFACGLVPTLRPRSCRSSAGRADPRGIRRLRHAGARGQPAASQPARRGRGRGREEPVGDRPVAVAPRRDGARLVERLRGLGAAAVGVDVIFAEPDRDSTARASTRRGAGRRTLQRAAWCWATRCGSTTRAARRAAACATRWASPW